IKDSKGRIQSFQGFNEDEFIKEKTGVASHWRYNLLKILKRGKEMKVGRVEKITGDFAQDFNNLKIAIQKSKQEESTLSDLSGSLYMSLLPFDVSSVYKMVTKISRSLLQSPSHIALIERLRESLRNNDKQGTLEALEGLKRIGGRRILKSLLELLFDEEIDSQVNREILMEIASFIQGIRSRHLEYKLKKVLKKMMRLERAPLEQAYPYFFDEQQGVYKQLKDKIIPAIMKDFRDELARGEKIRGHSAGGVYFYRDGAKLFSAFQAAILFMETMIQPDKLEIIVTDGNWKGLKQGKRGFYGIEWFIRDDRPLTREDKKRIKRYFDLSRDGRLQVKPHIRKIIKTEHKLLTNFRLKEDEPHFHFVLYNFVEYKVELREKEKGPLMTNIIAGNIVNNLKEKGRLVTTAEKWFDAHAVIHREGKILPVEGSFGNKLLKGKALVYKKDYSIINQEWLDRKFRDLKKIVSKRLGKPEAELKILDTAYELARYVHGNQLRANGEPYLIHLLEIVSTWIEEFRFIGKSKIPGSKEIVNVSDEIILAIALLHDAVEDYIGDGDIRKIIEQRFRDVNISDKIIEIILDGIIILTQREGESDESYLKRIIGCGEIYIKGIKIADRLYNLRTPKYKYTVRENREYLKATRDFVEAIEEEELEGAKKIFRKEMHRLYTTELAKKRLLDPANYRLSQSISLKNMPGFDRVLDIFGDKCEEAIAMFGTYLFAKDTRPLIEKANSKGKSLEFIADLLRSMEMIPYPYDIDAKRKQEFKGFLDDFFDFVIKHEIPSLKIAPAFYAYGIFKTELIDDRLTAPMGRDDSELLEKVRKESKSWGEKEVLDEELLEIIDRCYIAPSIRVIDLREAEAVDINKVFRKIKWDKITELKKDNFDFEIELDKTGFPNDYILLIKPKDPALLKLLSEYIPQFDEEFCNAVAFVRFELKGKDIIILDLQSLAHKQPFSGKEVRTSRILRRVLKHNEELVFNMMESLGARRLYMPTAGYKLRQYPALHPSTAKRLYVDLPKKMSCSLEYNKDLTVDTRLFWVKKLKRSYLNIFSLGIIAPILLITSSIFAKTVTETQTPPNASNHSFLFLSMAWALGVGALVSLFFAGWRYLFPMKGISEEQLAVLYRKVLVGRPLEEVRSVVTEVFGEDIPSLVEKEQRSGELEQKISPLTQEIQVLTTQLKQLASAISPILEELSSEEALYQYTKSEVKELKVFYDAINGVVSVLQSGLEVKQNVLAEIRIRIGELGDQYIQMEQEIISIGAQLETKQQELAAAEKILEDLKKDSDVSTPDGFIRQGDESTKRNQPSNLIGKLFNKNGKFVKEGISAEEEGGFLVFYDIDGNILYAKDRKEARIRLTGKTITTESGQEIRIIEDNENIRGFGSKDNIQYLIPSLLNEEIALYHEEKESYYARHPEELPEGINAHTFLRGCGKVIRNLVASLRANKMSEAIPNVEIALALSRNDNFTADELIKYLKENLPSQRHNPAEFALIRYNESCGKTGIELIYGLQDWEFGVANGGFSELLHIKKIITAIEELEKNKRKNKNIIAQILLSIKREDDNLFNESQTNTILAKEEFESQLDHIRQNNVTDKYKGRIINLLGRYLKRASLSDEERTKLEIRLRKFQEGKYNIYGFHSIVRGKDDFVLGWNNVKSNELFIAEDVISELKNRGPPTLVDEYLLHEIICPILGHYPAIISQQSIFPQHYQTGQYEEENGVKYIPGYKGHSDKPFKGLLREALREIITTKLLAQEQEDKGPDRHYKETFYVDEPKAQYYFETVIKLNLRLIDITARRIKMRNEGRTRELEETYDELDEIVERIKGFINEIEFALYPKYITRERNIRVEAKVKLEKAISLIEKRNEPAANAVLASVAGSFARELISLMSWRLKKRERSRRRAGFEAKTQRFWVLQGQNVKYPISPQASTTFRIYEPRHHDLLWEAFRSIDHQTKTEIEELLWLRDSYKKLDEIKRYLDREISQAYTLKKGRQLQIPSEKIEYIQENLAQIRQRLDKVILGVKDIIRYSLDLALGLNKIGEFKASRTILGVTLMFITLRGKAVRNIIENIQRGRLTQLRKVAEGRNQELLNRIDNILNALRRGDTRSAFSKIQGFLRAKRLTVCFKEPEFWWAKQLLGYSGRLLQKGDIERAEQRLKIVKTKIKEAQTLGQFMQNFRDLYATSNLKVRRLSEQEAFNMTFERFIKKAHLNKGSPEADLWWTRFYRASFIPLKIDNPQNKSERILNPLFQAVTDLITIKQTQHFKLLLRTFKTRKPHTFKEITRLINQNKTNYFGLSKGEKSELLDTLALDYQLSEEEKQILIASSRQQGESIVIALGANEFRKEDQSREAYGKLLWYEIILSGMGGYALSLYLGCDVIVGILLALLGSVLGIYFHELRHFVKAHELILKRLGQIDYSPYVVVRFNQELVSALAVAFSRILGLARRPSESLIRVGIDKSGISVNYPHKMLTEKENLVVARSGPRSNVRVALSFAAMGIFIKWAFGIFYPIFLVIAFVSLMQATLSAFREGMRSKKGDSLNSPIMATGLAIFITAYGLGLPIVISLIGMAVAVLGLSQFAPAQGLTRQLKKIKPVLSNLLSRLKEIHRKIFNILNLEDVFTDIFSFELSRAESVKEFEKRLSEVLGDDFRKRYDRSFLRPELGEEEKIYDALFELLGDNFDFNLNKLKFPAQESVGFNILLTTEANIYYKEKFKGKGIFKKLKKQKPNEKLLAFFVLYELLKNIKDLEPDLLYPTNFFIGLKKTKKNSDKGIELLFVDEGPGFEDIERAWEEAEYSTKGGEHQGMGLFLCYKLVVLTGLGEIEVTSGGEKVIYHAGGRKEIESAEDTGLTQIKITIYRPIIKSGLNVFLQNLLQRAKNLVNSVTKYTWKNRRVIGLTIILLFMSLVCETVGVVIKNFEHIEKLLPGTVFETSLLPYIILLVPGIFGFVKIVTKGYPSRDKLKELIIKHKGNTSKIASELGGLKRTISYWINKDPELKELAGSLRSKHPGRDKLKELIITYKGNTYKIAPELGGKQPTISYWINKDPELKELARSLRTKHPGRDRLKELIITYKGNTSKIATELGGKQPTVSYWINKDPELKELAGSLRSKHPGRDRLKELIITYKGNTSKIAFELGDKQPAVSKWINKDPELKELAGSLRSKHPGRDKLKELILAYQGNTSKIAFELGGVVSRQTISYWINKDPELKELAARLSKERTKKKNLLIKVLLKIQKKKFYGALNLLKARLRSNNNVISEYENKMKQISRMRPGEVARRHKEIQDMWYALKDKIEEVQKENESLTARIIKLKEKKETLLKKKSKRNSGSFAFFAPASLGLVGGLVVISWFFASLYRDKIEELAKSNKRNKAPPLRYIFNSLLQITKDLSYIRLKIYSSFHNLFSSIAHKLSNHPVSSKIGLTILFLIPFILEKVLPDTVLNINLAGIGESGWMGFIVAGLVGGVAVVVNNMSQGRKPDLSYRIIFSEQAEKEVKKFKKPYPRFEERLKKKCDLIAQYSMKGKIFHQTDCRIERLRKLAIIYYVDEENKTIYILTLCHSEEIRKRRIEITRKINGAMEQLKIIERKRGEKISPQLESLKLEEYGIKDLEAKKLINSILSIEGVSLGTQKGRMFFMFSSSTVRMKEQVGKIKGFSLDDDSKRPGRFDLFDLKRNVRVAKIGEEGEMIALGPGNPNDIESLEIIKKLITHVIITPRGAKEAKALSGGRNPGNQSFESKVVKIDKKGRVRIPLQIVKRLNIQKGQRFRLFYDDKYGELALLTAEQFDKIRSKLNPESKHESIMTKEERHTIREIMRNTSLVKVCVDYRIAPDAQLKEKAGIGKYIIFAYTQGILKIVAQEKYDAGKIKNDNSSNSNEDRDVYFGFGLGAGFGPIVSLIKQAIQKIKGLLMPQAYQHIRDMWKVVAHAMFPKKYPPILEERPPEIIPIEEKIEEIIPEEIEIIDEVLRLVSSQPLSLDEIRYRIYKQRKLKKSSRERSRAREEIDTAIKNLLQDGSIGFGYDKQMPSKKIFAPSKRIESLCKKGEILRFAYFNERYQRIYCTREEFDDLEDKEKLTKVYIKKGLREYYLQRTVDKLVKKNEILTAIDNKGEMIQFLREAKDDFRIEICNKRFEEVFTTYELNNPEKKKEIYSIRTAYKIARETYEKRAFSSSGELYLEHVLNVTERLIEWNMDDGDVLAAVLLHKISKTRRKGIFKPLKHSLRILEIVNKYERASNLDYLPPQRKNTKDT
ncbi:MAG: type II toxin-antitoxin system RelE/ParE family toxin, partial [Candidatus Omnitrophica bacterium]|nr:type II toxin-antitoxin system RelE/ParE family toxin [Candidatus Omnitrophota bacterium]